MRIQFTDSTCWGDAAGTVHTGFIVKAYERGKYLVRRDEVAAGQPDTQFVFNTQVIKVWAISSY